MLRLSVSFPEIQEYLITDASLEFHQFVNIVIHGFSLTVDREFDRLL